MNITVLDIKTNTKKHYIQYTYIYIQYTLTNILFHTKKSLLRIKKYIKFTDR